MPRPKKQKDEQCCHFHFRKDGSWMGGGSYPPGTFVETASHYRRKTLADAEWDNFTIAAVVCGYPNGESACEVIDVEALRALSRFISFLETL